MNASTVISSAPGEKLCPSPEFGFLVACLRARLAGPRALAEVTVPHDLNWDTFKELSSLHRVVLFAGRAVAEIPAVPPAIRQHFQAYITQNQFRAIRRLVELEAVVGTLARAGLRVLTLKGPVLSAQVHGDFSWRQSTDFDLVVAPEDIAAADQLLRARGYERTIPAADVSPAQHARFLRRSPHYTHYHHQRQIGIELHWRLLSNPGFLPLPFEELYAARQTVHVHQTDFATLSPVHLVLHLCCHGAHHEWERLAWINDLAVLQNTGRQDWPATLSAADRLGLTRVVALGASVGHELLQCELPPAVRAVCERDRRVARLVKTCLNSVATYDRPAPTSRWQRIAYRLQLVRHLRYWQGMFMEDVLQVTRSPCSTAPGALLPLYALLRPWFWLKRRLTARPG